jgi:hypothetical protein
MADEMPRVKIPILLFVLGILVALILVATYGFHVERKEVAVEFIAACFDVIVGGILVTMVLARSKRRIVQEEYAQEALSCIKRAKTQTYRAQVLLKAHKSVPSWTKFVDTFAGVRSEVEEAIGFARAAFGANDETLVLLQQALGGISALENEYPRAYSSLATIQRKFEADHPDPGSPLTETEKESPASEAAAREKRKHPENKSEALVAHWEGIIAELQHLGGGSSPTGQILTGSGQYFANLEAAMARIQGRMLFG